MTGSSDTSHPTEHSISPETGLYPKNVFINRGNHETTDMNRVYGYEVRNCLRGLLRGVFFG